MARKVSQQTKTLDASEYSVERARQDGTRQETRMEGNLWYDRNLTDSRAGASQTFERKEQKEESDNVGIIRPSSLPPGEVGSRSSPSGRQRSIHRRLGRPCRSELGGTLPRRL